MHRPRGVKNKTVTEVKDKQYDKTMRKVDYKFWKEKNKNQFTAGFPSGAAAEIISSFAGNPVHKHIIPERTPEKIANFYDDAMTNHLFDNINKAYENLPRQLFLEIVNERDFRYGGRRTLSNFIDNFVQTARFVVVPSFNDDAPYEAKGSTGRIDNFEYNWLNKWNKKYKLELVYFDADADYAPHDRYDDDEIVEFFFDFEYPAGVEENSHDPTVEFKTLKQLKEFLLNQMAFEFESSLQELSRRIDKGEIWFNMRLRIILTEKPEKLRQTRIGSSRKRKSRKLQKKKKTL